jgi:lipoprotein-releasing system permease protein
MSGYDTVAARVRAVSGVVRVTPVVDGQVMASQGDANAGVIVRGIRQNDLAKTPVAEKLRPGSLAYFGRDDTVIVGAGLAAKLGVQVGGDITLIAPRGNITPFGATPRIKTYHVISVFHIGNTLYDSNYIFMPLEEAQLYFNYGDTVSGLEVMITDPEADLGLLPALTQAAGPTSQAVPWQNINSAFFEAIEVERNVMFLILSLIILVAALNIVSGLIMLVKDKGPDIAIMRTMGATQGAIMRIFLITGASIGVVGTLVGLLAGVVICRNIEAIRQFLSWLTSTELFPPTLYFLSRLPADMDLTETTAVVVMALALSLLATLYPSWRAARLDPVEALRYE